MSSYVALPLSHPRWLRLALLASILAAAGVWLLG